MKKTVNITLPARKAIPARKSSKVVVLCDFCSKPVKVENYGGGGGQCWLCERDICNDHTIREYDGDYSTKYCTTCHSLYMPEVEALEERHWKEKEALERKIKRISIAAPKSNVGGDK